MLLSFVKYLLVKLRIYIKKIYNSYINKPKQTIPSDYIINMVTQDSM